MRILLVNKYYPPHIGGVEEHVRDVAEGLAAVPENEVRVIVSNNERRYREEQCNGVEIIRLPRLTERASTPIARHFGAVLAHEAKTADIVHFHFPYPWGEFEWCGQAASKTTPYVVTYHSDIVRQRIALAVYRPFLNLFLDRARLIMASSPQLIKYSPFLEARTSKCRQIDFGVPVSHIVDDPAARTRAARIRADHNGRPLVLFVGRLVYYKGIPVLAEALSRVDADFIVVGRGPDAQLLRDSAAQATAAGWPGRLDIIDYATDEELAALYHAADVFTLPSTEPSEAFGLVQIEAQAAGTPVVSTRLRSGVPYANLDGVTGLTVPPNDANALAGALNALLADAALRERLGRQAQRRALSQFNVTRMVGQVTAVYQEALNL
ncbi:MAG: glycosyltransferase [Actinomycetes bacterium]|jgi:rhamnosyl/mannosyltransferase|nr:glycosyltransferase [Actinomycetes bacterium]